MNLIVVGLDLISIVALLFGLGLLLTRWKRTAWFDYSLLLLLLLMSIFSTSNLLQWLAISSQADPYESFVLPMMWSFFFIANLNRIEFSDLAHKENALRENEKKYRALLENLPQKVFLKDRRSVYVSCNANYARDLGISPGEISGRTDFDFYPAELARKYREDDARLMDRGETQEIEERYLQAGHEAWVHTVKTPVRNEAGTVSGILGIFWDITVQKLATEALRESEANFRAFFENVAVGTAQIDSQGRFFRVNDRFCEITGYSRQELLSGMGPVDLDLPEDREEDRGRIARFFSAQEPYKLEKRYVRKDGRVVWVAVSAGAVRDSQGIIRFTVGVIEDITERKQAEAEVRRLNSELELRVAERTAQLQSAIKELEAFSYSVSHDLRAPLRHMAGFVSLLQKRAPGALDEKSRHYLSVIADAANQMGVLIDDILSFSRMGRIEMSKTSTDMAALVAEVVAMVRHDTRERLIDWSIGELPAVTADPAMLKTVWINLIGNAVKYTSQKPRAAITVGWRRDEAEDVFFVKDNGAGFDMRYVDKLFGLFQRLHRAEDFEGTGVGLANVRRIIQRHGGHTWAEGAEGQGATFYFSLPRSQPVSRQS